MFEVTWLTWISLQPSLFLEIRTQAHSVVSAILAAEDAWTLNVNKHEMPVTDLFSGTGDYRGLTDEHTCQQLHLHFGQNCLMVLLNTHNYQKCITPPWLDLLASLVLSDILTLTLTYYFFTRLTLLQWCHVTANIDFCTSPTCVS